MKNGMENLHPIVLFIFFASCLTVTMLIMHPVFLVISFLSGLLFILVSGGVGDVVRSLRFNLVTSLMIILINPLISHGGITVITYLPDGNPLTMESVIFGCAAALLLSSAVNWFYCINRVLTSDKLIYLFGRAAPRLALLISMVLAFTEKLSSHYKEVRNARKCFGAKNKRIKGIIKNLSSTIQWALENSVDTADSMHSRGYASGKRTSYSLYHIRRNDIIMIILFAAADIIILYSYYSGQLYFSYYPMITVEASSFAGCFSFIAFGMLCMMPVILKWKEDAEWKYLQSGI